MKEGFHGSKTASVQIDGGHKVQPPLIILILNCPNFSTGNTSLSKTSAIDKSVSLAFISRL